MRIHGFTIGIILWFLAEPLNAASPFTLNAEHFGEPLGRHLLLYKDDSTTLTKEQVATRLSEFVASQDDYPNWKMTPATTWAYFQIENQSPEERPLFLENYYAMTDSITLYAKTGDKFVTTFQLGDRHPFSDRPVFYRHPIFPLTAKPGLNEFMISIQTSGPNRMPFQIWTPKELQFKMSVENFLLGGAFGLSAFMVIYNFFIFLSLRSKTYLFYVAYGLSFILMQTAMQGVAGYMFRSFTLQEWFGNSGFLVGVQSCNLFATLFSMRFLDLGRRLPRIHRIMRGICWFYALVLALVFAQVSYRTLAAITNAMTFFSTLSMMGMGIYFSWKRHRPAYFYTLAWVFVLLGGLAFALSNIGVAPVNFLTTYGSLLGGCCEMSLLSFALADRVRHLREKRNQERELYIQNLMQKDQETHHSYTQLAKIVYPHQISQMMQGSNLEDTMQTGRSNAVVIVFDVIGSTRFAGANKQEFFQRVFISCYQRMMRQYDEKHLMAEAYRIKELGDGFMCSVGFPFPVRNNSERNAIALALSLDFVEIFNRIRTEMYPDQDCYCSIGIAEGEVHGFYPIAGVREYDLHGEAIVLANRYENLRRVLFTTVEANILSVQTSFVAKLPLNKQEQFVCHELGTWKDFQIRDDPNARTFYSMFLNQKEPSGLHSRSA